MPDPLTLSPPEEDGRGTTGWLAGRFDVSVQTVRNWHREGMPSCGNDPRRGGPMFDLAACSAWVKANRPASLHGGKRRNAGRKPDRPPAEMAPAIDAAATRESMRESARERLGLLAAAAGAPDASERVSFDGLSRLTDADLKLLAFLEPEVTGFNAAQATRLQNLARSQRDQMAIAEARKLLMDREEVRRALTGLMETARAAFESLPGKLVPALMAALKLTPDREASLRAIIEREVGRVVGDLARMGRETAEAYEPEKKAA